MLVFDIVYLFCLVSLSVYGLNSLLLVWLYLRHRHDPVPLRESPVEWPYVTVQLPIYNERHTAERLVRAVGQFDYPRDRLEIQVLDDSTDDTRQIVARVVQELVADGVDASHITRASRSGFKAGALAVGMARAKGELLAMFDADFMPGPDFLVQVVSEFADRRIGCVQTRWGHVNREYSLLTRLQALGVDGHFVIEQTARSRAGLFLNFNGTAGVWRKKCVEESGGWRADTLTEDLDLSYRAQLRGWRIAYLRDVVVPAELPAQISALKRQQARWAQGSIQTAIKMIGPLVRSGQPWTVKLEGILHLTGYAVHPLMLLTVLLILPMRFSQSWALSVAPWLMISSVGPPTMYAAAQRFQGGKWRVRIRVLPVLVLLGMGIALSNTCAVLKAILGVHQTFQRTPKYALRGSTDAWVDSLYAMGADSMTWAEIGLAGFALALLAWPGVTWGLAPWLLMYAGGFAYVAGLGLYQGLQRRRWLARQPRAAARTVGRTLRGELLQSRESLLGRGK